jgi:hypothetical protein
MREDGGVTLSLPEGPVRSCGHHRRHAARADSGINFVQHNAMRQRDAGDGTDQEYTFQHYLLLRNRRPVYFQSRIAKGDLKKSHDLVGCRRRAST